MSVGHALTLVAQPPQAEAAVNIGFSFKVNGATGVVHWALSSGSAPAGTTLSFPAGLAAILSGAPTTGGVYSFVLQATDTGGTGDVALFPITLNVANAFTQSFPDKGLTPGYASFLPPVYLGVPYSARYVTYTGGYPPVTFYDVTGAIATAGLTLDPSTGVISGTVSSFPAGISPGGYGNAYTIQVGARDAAGLNVVMTSCNLAFLPTPVYPSSDSSNAVVRGADGALYVPTTGGATIGSTSNTPTTNVSLPINSTTVIYGTHTLNSGITFTRAAGATLVVM